MLKISLLFRDGVYFDKSCSTTFINHGALVVGYDTDEADQDYWIVKNNFGTGWGQDGYIWMARNRGNMCGIASYACYPAI